MKSVLKSFPEIELVWHPFELRPKPTDRVTVEPDPETGELWDAALISEAAKEGLALKQPFSPMPYTDRAFQGMHYVVSRGGDVQAYNDRIFKAVFVEGRDIGDIDVLVDIAEELGLEVYTFNNLLRDGLFKEAQEGALKHAYFGSEVEEVPTYKIMKLRISGAVGRSAMEKFIRDGMAEEEKARKDIK
jgi:predicted DsbA family dithiol-disulfide isomerase